MGVVTATYPLFTAFEWVANPPGAGPALPYHDGIPGAAVGPVETP